MDIKILVIGLVVGLIVGAGAGSGMNSPQISSLQNQLNVLQPKVNSLQTEANKVPGLQQQVTTLTNEKSTLQSQVNTLQVQVDSWSTEKGNYQSQITSLQNQITLKNTEISSLNNQIQLLQSQTRTQINVKTNIPADFRLISNNTFTDVLGNLEFVGELGYIGQSNVEFVQIFGAFFDSAGILIDTDYSYTALSILRNGDVTPFKIRSAGGDRVASYIISIDSRTTSDSPYRSFSISGVTTSKDFLGDLKLSGSVTNTGTSQAKYTKCIVTFYDSNQKILDYDTVYVTPDTLNSNQTGMFEASLGSEFKSISSSIIVESS